MVSVVLLVDGTARDKAKRTNQYPKKCGRAGIIAWGVFCFYVASSLNGSVASTVVVCVLPPKGRWDRKTAAQARGKRPDTSISDAVRACGLTSGFMRGEADATTDDGRDRRLDVEARVQGGCLGRLLEGSRTRVRHTSAEE
jgi:hypothetical protein